MCRNDCFIQYSMINLNILQPNIFNEWFISRKTDFIVCSIAIQHLLQIIIIKPSHCSGQIVNVSIQTNHSYGIHVYFRNDKLPSFSAQVIYFIIIITSEKCEQPTKRSIDLRASSFHQFNFNSEALNSNILRELHCTI